MPSERPQVCLQTIKIRRELSLSERRFYMVSFKLNPTNNSLGSTIENLIENNDFMFFLNDNSPTNLHPATGTFFSFRLVAIFSGFIYGS